MTAATSLASPSSSEKLERLGFLPARPVTLALLVTLVATVARFTGTTDSDGSWQLWIAHRIAGGAHLYRDIVEVNPPLWFWMALPMDALASVLHVRAETICIAAMGALSALALAATSPLIPGKSGARTIFLAYAALILVAMPWMHSGQREQIVLLGTLPYAALAAARRGERHVPVLLATAIGASAALGFALKPYFLLVPIMLELWLISHLRRSWRPLRPETAAVFAVGALYALALLIFAPAYLNETLPLVRLAYGVTGAPHVSDLLQPQVLVAGGALALTAANGRHSFKRAELATAAALLIAALAFAAVYFIQAKGWPYHAIPLLGCASLGLAAALTCQGRAAALSRIAAPALLCLPFILTFVEAKREPAPSQDLVQAVDGMRPGDSVGFIATDPALAWSIVLQRDLAYPSRYMGFWMMRAVVSNEQRERPDPRLTVLGRKTVADAVRDFRCRPPRRIIVARPRAGEDGFDILPFFERDAGFRSLIAHYRPVSRTTLQVFDLSAPYAPLPASACTAAAR